MQTPRATESFVASTGEKFELHEAMAPSLLRFRPGSADSKHPAAIFRDYLADCMTQGGKPVASNDLLRLTVFDFVRALKRVRVLSYGPEVRFEVTCRNKKCKPYEPVVDINALQETPPVREAGKVSLSTGKVVVLRPDTWGQQEAEAETPVTDPLLARVVSVDDEPFMGCTTLTSRELVAIQRSKDKFDGDPGVVVTHFCPDCGARHRSHLLFDSAAMIAFFELAALL